MKGGARPELGRGLRRRPVHEKRIVQFERPGRSSAQSRNASSSAMKD
jgi:hypothetical protein